MKQSDCFSRAFDLLNDHGDGQIVHGWVRQPAAPFWSVHAWFESEGRVYDPKTSNRPLNKDGYYNKMEVREERIKRYSITETLRNTTSSNSFGPFDRQFFFALTYAGDDPLEQITGEKLEQLRPGDYDKKNPWKIG